MTIVILTTPITIGKKGLKRLQLEHFYGLNKKTNFH